MDMSKTLAVLALCTLATASVLAAPPPPSPGIQVGITARDYQGHGSSGHRIARLPGSDTVHLAWMFSDNLGQFAEDYRNVKFMTIGNAEVFIPENFGMYIGDDEGRPGYPSVAVGSDNAAVVAFHKSDPEVEDSWAPWLADYVVPPTYLRVDNALTRPVGSCAEALWPQVAVGTHPGGDDITHVVALDFLNFCPAPRLWYWRRDANGIQGAVVIDTVDHLNYAIATDPESGRTAVVFSSSYAGGAGGLINLHYYESQTEGAGWISGAELGAANRIAITNYSDSTGPQAWPGIAAEYDNDGVLHVVWVEQEDAFDSKQCALMHWDNSSGVIREITRADWPLPLSTGVFNLGLASISMGIGDGATQCQAGAESNENYLYVVYTQFAGPTAAEQADHSYDEYGRYNGELYLTVSRDGGTSWSIPVNLSNTKTPSCNPGPADGPNGEPFFPDSVCRSEMWASIGKYVSDIDLLFISDVDAGGIVQGEGSWQLNPVHYYRIPGGTTDAAFVCPNFEPAMTISGTGTNGVCGAHSIDGIKQDTTTYTFTNTGSAVLRCSLYVLYQQAPIASTQWLRINDTTQALPFTVPIGGSIDVLLVADPDSMDAGIYRADVYLSHNSPGHSNPKPLFLDFWVSPCHCHADPVCDGAIDVLDVVDVIGIAFRGMPPLANENCPAIDEDIDCSGNIDVLDVVHVIAVAFRGQAEAGEFCQPCSSP